MSRYTVNYFASIGQGEPICLMFLVAGVEFTDNILATEDWSDIKNDSELLLINRF